MKVLGENIEEYIQKLENEYWENREKLKVTFLDLVWKLSNKDAKEGDR